MRAPLLVLSLLLLLPSISLAQPEPVQPLNPDISGTWYLDQVPIPHYEGPARNCADEMFRRTNYAMYGTSYIELRKKPGERLELAQARPGSFDLARYVIYEYEGRLHYNQGYGGGSSWDDFDYFCAEEMAEYEITGTVRFGLDDDVLEMSFGGPIVPGTRYMHGGRASFGGTYADAEGTVIYGAFRAGTIARNGTEGTFVNYSSLPTNCTTWLHEAFSEVELGNCQPRRNRLTYLRRVDAPLALEREITGTVFEGSASGVATATVIPHAGIVVREQDEVLLTRNDFGTEGEFARYMRLHDDELPFHAITRAGPDGRFSIKVPLYYPHPTGKRLVRRRYAVGVFEAQRNDVVAGEPRTFYYRGRSIYNITAPDDVELLVQPNTVLEEKLRVTEQLIALGPNRYAPIERQVVAHVERLIATPALQTDAAVEAVRSALMAEQIAVPAVGYARELIDKSIDPLTSVIVEAVKHYIGKLNPTSRELGDATEEALSKSSQAFEAANTAHGFGINGANIGTAFANTRDAAVFHARKNGSVAAMLILRNIKAAITAVGAALRLALVEFGVEIDVAQGIDAKLVDVLLALAEALLTIDPTEITGVAIQILVDALKEPLVEALVDGTAASYTGFTEDSLELSRDLMIAARSGVSSQGAVDNAYQQVMRPMHEDVAKLFRALAYVKALADTAGTTKDVFEFVPLPLTQAVAKNAFLTQMISQVTIVAQGLGAAFVALPEMVDRGANLSFNRSRARGMQRPGGFVGTSTAVATDMVTALSNLETSTRRLHEQVKGGTFGLVIDDLASGDPAISVPSALGQLDRAHARMNAALQGLRDDDDGELRRAIQILAARVLGVQLEAQDVLARVFRIFNGILDGLYPTPAAAGLLRARTEAAAHALSLRNGALEVIDAYSHVQSAWRRSAVRPAIRTSDPVIESISVPGARLRTRSPETFTVRARVENPSVASVGPLTARLTIRSPAGVARVVGPTEVAVPTLAADDGVAEAGPDEHEAAWTVEVTAPVDQPGSTLFVIEVVGTSSIAAFESSPALGVIEVDHRVSDAEDDGMRDGWEVAMGLDPSRDDSGGDADGDGLPNRDEYRRGTKANLADSDGDGRSDRDEVRGTPGKVPSDPMAADTDGDGVDDGMDADPQDVGNSMVSRSEGEPAVRLSACAVSVVYDDDDLTKSVAFVQVENAGTSSLAWTVEGGSGAVRVIPRPGDVVQGPSGITVVFAEAAAAPVELWVSDVSGSERDRQRLLVYAGQALPAGDPCAAVVPGADGGVGGDGGGGGAVDGGGGADGGGGGAVDAGVGPGAGEDGGCGCASTGAGDAAWVVVLLVVGLGVRRRR